jgi:pilus assembly protein CpaB
MRTGNTTLAALPRERLRRLIGTAGWARSLALRRVVAALLTLLAVVLALRPAPAAAGPSVGVLVAAHDLPPGVLLTPADLRLAALPPDAVPSGALRDPAAAAGRVLAGPARAGEPLTDVRLLGPENTWLASGDPSAAAVPVRLADAGVAELLHPGTRVDVVALEERSQRDAVLATDAVVLTVRPAGSGAGSSPGASVGSAGGDHGRLVVVALARAAATKVAAVSLGQPVTVTLR